jgi:hypothetical protein
MTPSQRKNDAAWKPGDVIMAVTCGSACLGLIILVSGTAYGLITGRIDPKALGGITGLWHGSGVLGLAFILYFVLRLQLRPRK